MRHEVYMSPGPPWYAAQCRLEEGHPGECEFGTLDEAKAAYLAEKQRGTYVAIVKAYIPLRDANEIALEMIRHAEFW